MLTVDLTVPHERHGFITSRKLKGCNIGCRCSSVRRTRTCRASPEGHGAQGSISWSWPVRGSVSIKSQLRVNVPCAICVYTRQDLNECWLHHQYRSLLLNAKTVYYDEASKTCFFGNLDGISPFPRVSDVFEGLVETSVAYNFPISESTYNIMVNCSYMTTSFQLSTFSCSCQTSRFMTGQPISPNLCMDLLPWQSQQGISTGQPSLTTRASCTVAETMDLWTLPRRNAFTSQLTGMKTPSPIQTWHFHEQRPWWPKWGASPGSLVEGLQIVSMNNECKSTWDTSVQCLFNNKVGLVWASIWT